jgi:hypothetical protein
MLTLIFPLGMTAPTTELKDSPVLDMHRWGTEDQRNGLPRSTTTLQNGNPNTGSS